MNTKYFILCASLCALPAIALADDTPRARDRESNEKTQAKGSASSVQPSQVLTKLHETNLMEIEAAKIAKDNAASDDVKDYAEKLKDDHEKADDEVKGLAKDRQLTLPKKLASDSDGASMLGRLRTVRGAEFDRQYLDMMVNDHEKAIGMVRAWLADVQDAKIKDLLDDLLPKLEEHRDKARKLAKKN